MVQSTRWMLGGMFVGLVALAGVVIGAGGSSGALAAQDATPTLLPVVDPVLGDFDPASVAEIDLAEYPIVPEISEQALALYRAGLDQGNNPNSFAKVGDCMTDNP
ncbi:MAG TPA: hypothetical protein VHP83_00470, partial [Aggregatilineaceae bacterium]|nr:hypothetical protein [Aggregatilineaceae bacterium]